MEPKTGATHAYAVFCEDVRDEVSGQASYIGVFRDSIEVNEFPLRLARLHIMMVVANEDGIDGKSVSFALKFSEQDDLLESSVPVPQSSSSHGNHQPVPTRIEIHTILEDFGMKAPGMVLLEMKLDDNIIYRCSMRVVTAS